MRTTTTVLGLHKDPWHNSGAAVVREVDGRVAVVSLAEERCNREKDSRSFPELSIRACLDAAGVRSPDDIDLVVIDYIVRPDWRSDYLDRPCVTDGFLASIAPAKIQVINHHLAHACAVFYSSSFDSAAVLVVDGRGSENETQSLFAAGPDGIELLESTATIGIGLLYAAATQTIGFRLLQEGKTMGLAPYGAEADGPIYRFPTEFSGVKTDYSRVCVEGRYDLAIAPSRPLATFADRARAAFDVQQACEDAMLHLAAHARAVTGSRYLCLTGGVALNSVANHRVLQSGLFDDVFINPAASDTGIPLGAALHGYHHVLGRPRCDRAITPYVGPTYGRQAVDQAIASAAGHRGLTIVEDHAADTAADLLAANRIVACYQGGSEMGPRALGNRSILMSPLVAGHKDVLNREVKHREPFRPFAPAVLEEHAREYFEIDRPSPYMLLVSQVHASKRAVIPAVTHVDGSARLQTVTKDSNAPFYALIAGFGERTGVPVLLNTSFNVDGEPIVERPEDAVRCFLGTGIDALLIGDRLLVKPA